jgi:CheY-like chemotaxis protein
MSELRTGIPPERRVLLLEDHEGLRYAMQKVLERRSVIVDATGSPVDAMEWVDERRYDAILLDLATPGPLNGFAVLSHLELEKPELLERVFILSGMPEQTIMHAAPNLLPRYFRKPFDVEAVIDTVLQIALREPDRPDALKLLVADDDEDTRFIVTEIARRIGREVTAVSDGHEAIRRLAGAPYAAVVVDLLMPYVDGYGVLRYLRETHPELLARTIVLTAMPSRYRANPLLELVYGVFEKPVPVKDLSAAIRSCLDSARPTTLTSP